MKTPVSLTKQLAIFLENRPGMLAEVCEALAQAGLNILAVSTSDTVDHTVIRMVVDNPRKALLLFEERGTLVVDDEVLMVEASNEPGVLARLARQLCRGKVNIEYCYCASSPGARQGLLVFRVSNPAKALKLLRG